MPNSIITATGRCIPEVIVDNADFADHLFYTKQKAPEAKPTSAIIRKFVERSGIGSRRYAAPGQVASDLGAIALRHALDTSGTDIHSIDLVIGASNYGDITADRHFCDLVPNLSTRILHKAGYDGVRGGSVMARDVVGACPGWLDALMLADMEIQGGTARRVAVVGAETLSRVCDPHDKDSMLFADGAGAAIVEAIAGGRQEGILGWDRELITYFDPKGSDVTDPSQYITMGPSHNPNHDQSRPYLHMIGPNVSQLAIRHVPRLIRRVLEQADVGLEDVAKFLLHQANKTLDQDMARAAGVAERDLIERVPITLDYLGNASLATIPIMLDLILRKELVNGGRYRHSLKPLDHVVFASVGAGMIVNALLYRMPRTDYWKQEGRNWDVQ